MECEGVCSKYISQKIEKNLTCIQCVSCSEEKQVRLFFSEFMIFHFHNLVKHGIFINTKID